MDTETYKIFIKGEDLTKDILLIEPDGNKINVMFKNGRSYSYSRSSIRLEPIKQDEQRAKKVFAYLRSIADSVGLNNDYGQNILLKNLNRINEKSKETVLYDFLSGEYRDNNSKISDTPLYPFGFNISQQQAVDNALTNQLSIIEGPPGTGKTQTILNIIANIVMAGKTVAVVSANNSATANVLEKLQKYDLGIRSKNGQKLSKAYLHRMIQNPFYIGTAKWGEFTFEHRHPRLLDKATWDKCQDILNGRNSHKSTRWGSIQYLYRGLITDYWSGRVVTTERKKNKYNYLMTWDESGKHVAVNEDIVTGQIVQILEQLQISREMVDGVAEYLKSAKEMEAEYNKRIMAELARNIATAEKRKDNLLNMYLDGKIDDTTYNAKNAELGTQLDILYGKQRVHRAADDTVNDTIVKFFHAAQHVADNFIKSSEVDPKRTLLKSIFRTLKLKGKTLCYDLNFPFNILGNYTESKNWRR